MGLMQDLVIFDAPTVAPDGTGGQEVGWTVEPESLRCHAEFIYARGSEAIDAARLSGRAIYKLKIRANENTRAITPAWRMRDARRDTIYNLREVDAITRRGWIYIVVESGVAT